MACGANKDLVFIVAGEASADLHASALVDCLKGDRPELSFFGVGGEGLRKRGVDVLFPAEALSIFGLFGFKDLRRLLSGLKQLKKAIRDRKPAVAVLLDLPDFNLLLARYLKKQGVPVVYYISPQVWAWRKYRIHTIRRVVTRMLVLFPFEKRFYDEAGVPAEFVGHPLLEQISARTAERPQSEIHAAPHVALLPGSRSKELEMHGELLREVASRLRALYPNVQIQIPVAPTLKVSCVKPVFGDLATVTEASAESVLKWADVALVASGTATLETALVGTPFALFYRVSKSSAWVYRHLMRYAGFIGMPNILLKAEVVREFFQDRATVDGLVGEAERLLSDETYRHSVSDQLKQCRELLGRGNANQLAAAHVLEVLRDANRTQASARVLTAHAKPA